MVIQADEERNQAEISREAESTADRLVQHWTQIVRGENLEVPGLLLTPSHGGPQPRRRFVRQDTEALVEARFLQ